MRLVVRPATKEDIDRYSTMHRYATMRAWVGDLDGELIGMGGLALIGGRWYAFLDIKDAARPHKMAMMRAAKLTMATAKELGIKFLYVQPDLNEDGAVKWLTRLGFRRDTRDPHIYRWTACQE